MKHAFLSLIALMAIQAVFSQTLMSLEQAIAYAVEQSEDVRLSKLNADDAAAQIIEQRAFGVPQLSAEAGYMYNIALPVTILPEAFGVDPNTGQPDPNFDRRVRFGVKNNLMGTLTLRTMLFDGSYFVGLEAARKYREYTLREVDATKRQKTYQVIQAFMPVLLVNEQLRNLDDNIKNLTTVRNETLRTYEEGFAELLDVERLDLSIAMLQADRVNLENTRSMLINQLKTVMGFPVTRELDISGTLDEKWAGLASLKVDAPVQYTAWPEYDVAQRGMELANLNVRLNKNRYLPSLDAFANLQQMYLGDSWSDGTWATASVAGIGMKIPIFDGLLTRAKVQRAKLTHEMNRTRVRQLEQTIDLSVANARKQHANALATLAQQETNLSLAEKIYQTTRIKYKEGLGSSMEVNIAEQSLFSVQRQHIQAKFDVVMALYQLRQALGQ